MDKINLYSVLDKLVKEDQEEAKDLLHQWFLEACTEINNGLTEEKDEEDDEEEVDESAPDIVDEDTLNEFSFGGPEENLSPISGIQDMDAADIADADAVAVPDDGMGGDEGGDVGLEDRVGDLESELQMIKAEIAQVLGDELPQDLPADLEGGGEEDASDVSDANDEDTDESFNLGEAEGDEEEDEDEENVKEEEEFSDLEEAFMLEPVKIPDLSKTKTAGAESDAVHQDTRSPIPHHGVEDRVGGEPIEIRAVEYTGTGREDSPKPHVPKLRKNQLNKATDNLEHVGPMGPKDALLNKSSEVYPEEKNQRSMIQFAAKKKSK